MAQPQCPLCAAPINEDFGLIECVGCGAQLVVHMDGRVEHSGSELDGAEIKVTSSGVRAPRSQVTEVPEFLDQIAEFEIEEQTSSGVEKQTQTHIKQQTQSQIQEQTKSQIEQNSLNQNSEGNFENEPHEDQSEEVQEVQDEPTFDFGGPEPETEQYESRSTDQAPSQVDSPDLQDVAQFANSSESGGREGNLKYSIIVTGIDTADVREAFKEALTDKKLLWDIDEILKKIKMGKVSIENVSSTKAYIVVTRLKHLPLKVTWEQHAIHQG